MNKIVTLLRHAKSSRDNPALADIDRPLAERGRRDAPRMAAWISATGITPDLVLCSTSVRTRETLALVASSLPSSATTRFEAELYHAEADVLLSAIWAAPKGKHHVLIVGHNPGFHELTMRLVGAGSKELRASVVKKFSTCGCAVLTFAANTWADVGPKSGTLTHWMSPKRLD